MQSFQFVDQGNLFEELLSYVSHHVNQAVGTKEDLIIPFLPDIPTDVERYESPKQTDRWVSGGALPVADKLLQVF